MIEPLRLSVDLDCPVEHAFEVWTKRISTWWPKGHSASGHPETAVHLEPHVGGRIYERTPDGAERDWGRIVRWEPPSHLGYEWHIGRDPDAATDVDLRFVDLGDARTRLAILHSGWEALGDEAASWRQANTGGWQSLLPNFVTAAEGHGAGS